MFKRNVLTACAVALEIPIIIGLTFVTPWPIGWIVCGVMIVGTPLLLTVASYATPSEDGK